MSICAPVRTPARSRASRSFALALLGCALLAVLVSLAFGSRAIPLGEVLGALFAGVDSDNATVITSQRLPRTGLGIAAGFALGMSGALMQAHTRNPLADPGLFGVNAGATFAVAVLVFGFGIAAPAALVAAALVGAAVVATLVFLLGLRGVRGGGMVMLAIVGTTLGALLASLTSAMVLLDRNTLDVLRFWEVGSISLRNTDLLSLVAPLYLLGVVLAVANAFSLNALGLGDEVAQSLGTSVRSARVVGILAITLLAGTTTAICGPIGFLGLVAPHLARAVTRHDQRWLVPLSGLAGVSILLFADTAGRFVLERVELEVGIAMALIGAPILLLLTRSRRLVPL